jgi:hypothetical protein
MRVDCHFDDFDTLVVLVHGEKTFLMCSPEDLDCDMSTNSSTGHPVNSHIHERPDIDPHFREYGRWYTVHLRADDMMYIPMHWWHQVCASPSTHSSCTHTVLHNASAHTNPTQVMTDNQPSFFCSWWFRAVNVKAPQITRYEDLLSKAPTKPLLDLTSAPDSPVVTCVSFVTEDSQVSSSKRHFAPELDDVHDDGWDPYTASEDGDDDEQDITSSQSVSQSFGTVLTSCNSPSFSQGALPFPSSASASRRGHVHIIPPKAALTP